MPILAETRAAVIRGEADQLNLDAVTPKEMYKLIELAAQYGHINVLDRLIQTARHMIQDWSNPPISIALEIAVQNHHIDAANFIIQKGFDKRNRWTTLITKIMNRILIEENQNYENAYRSFVIFMIFSGHPMQKIPRIIPPGITDKIGYLINQFNQYPEYVDAESTAEIKHTALANLLSRKNFNAFNLNIHRTLRISKQGLHYNAPFDKPAKRINVPYEIQHEILSYLYDTSFLEQLGIGHDVHLEMMNEIKRMLYTNRTLPVLLPQRVLDHQTFQQRIREGVLRKVTPFLNTPNDPESKQIMLSYQQNKAFKIATEAGHQHILAHFFHSISNDHHKEIISNQIAELIQIAIQHQKKDTLDELLNQIKTYTDVQRSVLAEIKIALTEKNTPGLSFLLTVLLNYKIQYRGLQWKQSLFHDIYCDEAKLFSNILHFAIEMNSPELISAITTIGHKALLNLLAPEYPLRTKNNASVMDFIRYFEYVDPSLREAFLCHNQYALMTDITRKNAFTTYNKFDVDLAIISTMLSHITDLTKRHQANIALLHRLESDYPISTEVRLIFWSAEYELAYKNKCKTQVFLQTISENTLPIRFAPHAQEKLGHLKCIRTQLIAINAISNPSDVSTFLPNCVMATLLRDSNLKKLLINPSAIHFHDLSPEEQSERLALMLKWKHLNALQSAAYESNLDRLNELRLQDKALWYKLMPLFFPLTLKNQNQDVVKYVINTYSPNEREAIILDMGGEAFKHYVKTGSDAFLWNIFSQAKANRFLKTVESENIPAIEAFLQSMNDLSIEQRKTIIFKHEDELFENTNYQENTQEFLAAIKASFLPKMSLSNDSFWSLGKRKYCAEDENFNTYNSGSSL